MDSVSSRATSLLRPRVAVAAIAAAATVTVGLGLYLTYGPDAYLDFWAGWTSGRGQGLHRQNAVRRARRIRRVSRPPSAVDGDDDDDNGLDEEEPFHGTNVQTAPYNPFVVAGDEWLLNQGLHERGMEGEDAVSNDNDGENQPRFGLGGPSGPGGDDAGTLDEFWLDEPLVQPAQTRDGHNIISLLFRVSEDNARRSAYVHRGCACNACGVVPIRGIRYRCANCADFDLCETCELQGLHTKTHIFYKVRVPAPPFGTRQVTQPVWYQGDPDLYQQQLPRSLMARLARETGFERQELEAYWEQWTYIANTEWRDDPDELGLAMDRKTFERSLVPSGGARHGTPNLIHDRMFTFYDTNGDGLIGFTEFLHGLTYRKRKDKMRRIFDGYDTDGDGLVSRRDFLRFFRAYYVLYKQMHRDILDGFDDVLNSTETHRHITGRQPLSSIFGRDTALPAANLQRMMPGKAISRDTAEVTVVDETQGVVQPNASDTATRQDMLTRLFIHPDRRREPSIFLRALGGQADGAVGSGGGGAGGGGAGLDANGTSSNGGTAGDNNGAGFRTGTAELRFLEALVDPPVSVRDLPRMLVGEQADALMTEDRFRIMTTGGNPSQRLLNNDGDTNDDDGARWAALPLDSDLHRPELAAAVAAARAQGHGRSRLPLRLTRGQISAQNEAYVDKHIIAQAKAAARRRLHDRWLQRHFYLDEEEGAAPPEGWQDDEDVLVRNELLMLGGGGGSGDSIDDDGGSVGDSGDGSIGGSGGGDGSVGGRESVSSVGSIDGGSNKPSLSAATSDMASQTSAPEPEQRLSQSRPSRVQFAKAVAAIVEDEDVDDDNEDNDEHEYDDNDDHEDNGDGQPQSRRLAPRVELPEAERDAGHEVMYQVMQQAFNELLDILFLDKELMAVAAAETKAVRDKYRHLFAHLDADGVPPTAAVVRDRSLGELLQLTGYTVMDGAVGGEGAHGEGGQGGGDGDAGEGPVNWQEGMEAPVAEGNAAERAPAEADAEEAAPALVAAGSSPSAQLSFSLPAPPDNRDLTLPQFRPAEGQQADDEWENTDTEEDGVEKEGVEDDEEVDMDDDIEAGVEDDVEDDAEENLDGTDDSGEDGDDDNNVDGTDDGNDGHNGGDGGDGLDNKEAVPTLPQDIPWSTLKEWQRIDLAEAAAREDGGWGRLRYHEFEQIFQREEMASNRLDYLGSWIDFCIP